MNESIFIVVISVYWNQDVYYEQFVEVGFELKKEFILIEVKTRRLDFVARGCIWKKPI